MNCKNCGKQVEPSWKFCRYCGAAINNNSGKSKNKKPSTWILFGSCALIVVLCGLLFFRDIGKKNQGALSTILENSADFDIPRIDAETYFEERADVVSVIDASKSDSVLSELQAADQLTARGFTMFPISSCYSMDGSFYTDTEISASSGEKHPLFTTYHVSSTGEYWTIYEINGSIIAYPVSYNLQSLRGVQLVVSESAVITSYDSESNQFFETVPDQNSLVVITVDHIDAETLEKLTSDALDSM